MPQPQIDESSLQNVGASLEETVEETQEEQTEEVQVEETAQPEKIKLGDREYTSDELSELVGLGSRAREIGESHGGFDKFVSEYGRKSERIGELKKQLEERTAQTTTQTTKDPMSDEALMEEARAQARKLGIVLKDDLDSYYQNRKGAEELLSKCTNLEETIDGSDGRPKFNTTEVLEFMNANTSFTDPMKAYEAMNLDKVASWKAEQLSKTRTGGIETMTNVNPNKQPQSVVPNKDNLRDLIAEQFS